MKVKELNKLLLVESFVISNLFEHLIDYFLSNFRSHVALALAIDDHSRESLQILLILLHYLILRY